LLSTCFYTNTNQSISKSQERPLAKVGGMSIVHPSVSRGDTPVHNWTICAELYVKWPYRMQKYKLRVLHILSSCITPVCSWACHFRHL